MRARIRESHRPLKRHASADAYSLRCTPQVHGAVRDSLAQAREMAVVELNSATIIHWFVRDANNGDIISGEFSRAAVRGTDQVPRDATLGGIVERRIEQMTIR